MQINRGLNCTGRSSNGGSVFGSVTGLTPFNQFLSLRGVVNMSGGLLEEACMGVITSTCWLNYTIAVRGFRNQTLHVARMTCPLICRVGKACEIADLFVWGAPLSQARSLGHPTVSP